MLTLLLALSISAPAEGVCNYKAMPKKLFDQVVIELARCFKDEKCKNSDAFYFSPALQKKLKPYCGFTSKT